MKRYMLFILILISAFTITSSLFSNDGPGDKDKTGMAPYEKDNFITIEGIIEEVNIIFNKYTEEDGLHLTVKAKTETYIVHVSPQWYAKKLRLKYKPGDQITISGATFIRKGTLNMYAALIMYKEKKTLNLRNPDTGDPLWKERNKDKKSKKKKK